QQDDDGEGDERSPEDLEVIAEFVEDAEVRAGRREHAVSVLRRGDVLACARLRLDRVALRTGEPAPGPDAQIRLGSPPRSHDLPGDEHGARPDARGPE